MRAVEPVELDDATLRAEAMPLRTSSMRWVP